MSMRQRRLPDGWYPEEATEIEALFTQWQSDLKKTENAIGCIVPHASWFFSGHLAFEAIASLKKDVELTIVLGGHLHPNSSFLGVFEESVETPLGELFIEQELMGKLIKDFKIRDDTSIDNTVEVQLPIVKWLFPDTQLICLRIPPDERIDEISDFFVEIAKGRNTHLIGSTDLTHYGPNYNFIDHGTGLQSRTWVEKTNDAGIITHILKLEPFEAMKHAALHQSACSSGAAALTTLWAKKMGIKQGRLINYTTSFEKHPADSFVGYCGIIF